DEDEVVATDVPDEAPADEQPFHDVVQDARQDVDDPITVVVAVPVVELLEVIEVRVADGEQLAVLHAPPDLALDLRRAGKPGGRVDGDVPRGPGHQAVRPARL